MFAHALQQLNEGDAAAAVEYLGRQGDALAVAKCYADLVLHLYHQQKDVLMLVVMARAGIQHALTAAATERSPARAAELRGMGKGMAYNLAAFTWPGWDEPGIELDGLAMALGLDAAQTNLRLALELNRAALPLSRAHWMLGGQQMANGDLHAACQSFAEAARLARAADTEVEALLADGYILVAQMLGAPQQPPLAQFADLKARLAPLEHGEFFCQQLDTALNVFLERA